MTRRTTPLIIAAAGALLISGAQFSAATPALQPDITTKAVLDPGANYTANWTRAQALKIQTDQTNATPLIPTDFPTMTDEVWVWDTWPLTDLDGNPVSYNGYNVIFSLTAPREGLFFGDRHWQARIGYFYSKNGQDWTYGGHLFPDNASFGLREWAGSTVLTEGNELHTFYTASGSDDSPPTIPIPGGGYGANNGDPLQRLAHAAGTIYADDDGVFFRGFDDHQIIAEADGELYQTMEQSEAGPIIYAFRDPFAFRDPVDGEIYALFEGNNPGVAGTHTCDPAEIGDVPAGHVVPADSRFYTGNIGLMKLADDDGDGESVLDGEAEQSWDLLPPLLSAECVNQQTERPHLVIKDGKYYLWTISHQFTFAPGLTGPDGLYGFVGDGLRSDYQPLNESALVLGNPAEAPLQNYSHFVMPNLLVESFIDTIPGPDGPVYGGTLAPTLQLEVFGEDGDQTRLAGVLPYGYVPATRAVDSTS